jgi:hypothetical protein
MRVPSLTTFNLKIEKSNKLKVVREGTLIIKRSEKSNKLKVVREGTLIIKRSEKSNKLKVVREGTLIIKRLKFDFSDLLIMRVPSLTTFNLFDFSIF